MGNVDLSRMERGTGSRGGEKVYAWKPMEDIGIADLPKGVTEA